MSAGAAAGADVPGTPRSRLRHDTLARIRAAAWHEVDAHGAAGLSLSRVAKAVGLSPQGLYRYVESRDELLTDLIVDAFDDLADTLEAALADAPADDHRERWLHVARAFRSWGLASPGRFALILGSPVPDYDAPPRTVAPAQRSNFLLLGLLAGAHRAGAVDLAAARLPTSPALAGQLDAYVASRGLDITPDVVRVGLSAWAQLHGLLSLEVFGHLRPLLPRSEALFDDEMQGMLDRIGYRR